MPHCTPEQLALAALREPLPADDAAHLDTCGQCRAEVASLRRGVAALAVPEFATPTSAVPPPPGVWAAIAGATGVTAAPRPERVAGAAPVRPAGTLPPVPGPPPPEAVAAPDQAVPPAATVAPPATVVPLRPRRSRLLLAAAAALVVGAGIGAGAVALGARGGEGLTVTEVALEPLDDSGASGEARVQERSDGSLVLEVDLTAAALAGEFYEVWLLDPDVEQLVSLGVVQGGGEASFALPPGIDLGEYPIVDVSVEPLDGDPSHSGVSVARGVLDS
ncbi:anti-sigma factor domain-containing protein [Geodermatophilus sp. CPCC 206100]|uniref:anti-sigma factor n=1 Tax=Geodermatophilus sp. CPCC 206100 TaxID=3020054 RepID=UPI003B00B991